MSTYGASKLAGEALIASYAYMFDLRGCGFRFGNVVGPRQTHGVGFDFARRLLASAAAGERRSSRDPGRRQPVQVVRARQRHRRAPCWRAHEKTTAPFAAYNVATGDYITVREIAALAVECVGLRPSRCVRVQRRRPRVEGGRARSCASTRRGSESLGWRCELNTREALRRSMLAMIPDMKAGRM